MIGKMKQRHSHAFTIIELLVVMAIIAMLLSLVLPRYIKQTDRAKDAALQENLSSLRAALDQYYGDNEHYPQTLNMLVDERYIRKIPIDPITNRNDTWVTTVVEDEEKKVIIDVHSGATGNGIDGTPYNSW